MAAKSIQEIWRGLSFGAKVIVVVLMGGPLLGIFSLLSRALPGHGPAMNAPVGDSSGALLLWAATTALYFAPSLVAWRKRNFWAILTLNLLLGWTVIGWIVALVWGMTNDAAVPAGLSR